MTHDPVQLKEVTTNTIQISQLIHSTSRKHNGKQFNWILFYRYWLDQKLLEIFAAN